MRVAEHSHWHFHPPGVPLVDKLIADGSAVDVTYQAGSRYQGATVAVDSTVFERFVAWDSSACRRHGISLDENHRLETLLRAGCEAASEAGGCFMCRTTDSQGASDSCERHVLKLTSIGSARAPAWLIRQ